MSETPGSDADTEDAGGPPNEGAPGHAIREDAAPEDSGEQDAERPNEGAPGHEPD